MFDYMLIGILTFSLCHNAQIELQNSNKIAEDFTKSTNLRRLYDILRLLLDLRFYLFKAGVTGERIAPGDLRLTLNEGENVVNKIVCDIVSVLGYPFDGNLFLVICNAIKRQKDRLAGVQA